MKRLRWFALGVWVGTWGAKKAGSVVMRRVARNGLEGMGARLVGDLKIAALEGLKEVLHPQPPNVIETRAKEVGGSRNSRLNLPVTGKESVVSGVQKKGLKRKGSTSAILRAETPRRTTGRRWGSQIGGTVPKDGNGVIDGF
jgi:hypothetical protein